MFMQHRARRLGSTGAGDVGAAGQPDGRGLGNRAGLLRRCAGNKGLIDTKRADQAINWMWNEISSGLVERLRADAAVAVRIGELEDAVRANRLSPTSAADELMETFIK